MVVLLLQNLEKWAATTTINTRNYVTFKILVLMLVIITKASTIRSGDHHVKLAQKLKRIFCIARS